MRVKLCGIRTVEAAQACRVAGVDFAGLNFVPGRSRAITPEFASELSGHLGAVDGVGIFQDQGVATVREIATKAGISVVQLHGGETPRECEALAPDFRIFKALDLRRSRDSALVAAYARTVSVFVIDGRDPGSGRTWDYSRLELQDGCLAGVPVLVAGGLHADNVGDVIASSWPWGVDCASGIELVNRAADCRFVDVRKIDEFVLAAHSAGHVVGSTDNRAGRVTR